MRTGESETMTDLDRLMGARGPSRLDMIEGVHMSEKGVGPIPISARTWQNGIVRYDLLGDQLFGNGDVVQFTHAVRLCGSCGGIDGACACGN